MSSPAEIIIGKLGGIEATAAACGVDISRVYRWTYTKKSGGTDGLIPTRHQQAILNYSRENKLGVKPADFFRTEAAA